MTAYTLTTTLSDVITSCAGTSTTCSRMSTRCTRSTNGTMIRSPGSTVALYRPSRSTTPRWYGRTILMQLNARTNSRKARMARTMIAAMGQLLRRRPSAGCRRRARLRMAGRGSPRRDVDAPRADDETRAAHVRHQHGGTGGDAQPVGALGLPRLAVDAHHAGLVLAGRDLVHDCGRAPLPPIGADGVDLVAAFEPAAERNEGGEAQGGHADEQRPLDDGTAPGERRHCRRGGADGERPHEEEDGREHLGQGEPHDGDQPDPAPGLRRVDVHGRGSCRSAATVPRRPCFGCTGRATYS